MSFIKRTKWRGPVGLSSNSGIEVRGAGRERPGRGRRVWSPSRISCAGPIVCPFLAGGEEPFPDRDWEVDRAHEHLNSAVLEAHREAGQPDRRGLETFPGADVVAPPVERTGDDAVGHEPLRQVPSLVETPCLNGEELAVDIEEGDFDSAADRCRDTTGR